MVLVLSAVKAPRLFAHRFLSLSPISGSGGTVGIQSFVPPHEECIEIVGDKIIIHPAKMNIGKVYRVETKQGAMEYEFDGEDILCVYEVWYSDAPQEVIVDG